ncbi:MULTISPECIES: phosphatase PAP2 family protein [Streptomyces]|uniref:Phosphatase PAP2 family protein n=1 Tax=Streptomyces plicatus TaxID=1922 RepID=A0ABW1Y2V1_STRPL|nr:MULTISPECIES: phosphatase PAP2 family protein [Streptomyces]WDI20893.1 phosphatase PAP2 family protein [Streptomyces enissocaesilis]MBQ0880898.1 phosphatase PAP2 family protein [Streptomyces sp. RT42]MBU8552216.1 phosphatase PAP2 family protein [Streptomyces sp. Osf17]MBU8559000.1 phosphatase PAP2 family protein [Streptomyces sp. Babs14]MDI3100744.1 phosphatase PAP2 family protein [Streptomyces sp. AN-3]
MPVSPPRALPALLAPPVLLFALITWQVLADGPLVGVDERASGALVHPDRLSEVLSDLGNVPVAVPVLALALVYVAWHGRAHGADRWWLPPLAGAAAMALVPALVAPLKAWTDRPGTPAVPPAVGYYPSGHTATAVVAYGAATLLLLPLLRSPAVRRGLVLLCVLLVLGASYGLVRRGYHWPLDVVASWCLGAVLLAGVAAAAGRTAPAVTRSTRRSSSGTPSSSSGPS